MNFTQTYLYEPWCYSGENQQEIPKQKKKRPRKKKQKEEHSNGKEKIHVLAKVQSEKAGAKQDALDKEGKKEEEESEESEEEGRPMMSMLKTALKVKCKHTFS